MHSQFAMVAFDADWWADHWWLVFPAFGFLMMFISVWMQHRRSRDWMNLMRTYAEHGKEPPASLTSGPADAWGNPWGGWGRYGRRYGGYFDVRRAFIYGAIAAGFGWAYYSNPAHNEGFGIVAIVMGVLAVGCLMTSMFRPHYDDERGMRFARGAASDDRPRKPDDK